ncbi:MAG TPA: tyrosine recombinase [Mariprofundaceae bacterium]|nr:tyrosine recombinase [Mariprofundaceae bacterium]
MAEAAHDTETKIEGILRRMAMLYGWSRLTVDAYQHDLFSFHRFISSKDKKTSAFTATQKQVTAYLALLQSKGLANSSIQRQRSAMATWFHYLQNERMRSDFPMQNVAKVMKALRLPKHLSEQHVEDLLAAPDISKAKGVRDRCVLELMYATGLRVSELASLKVNNINRIQQTLRVIGKGNKEREVPYGEEADIWLSRWLEVRKSESVHLFPSRGSHITRQTLWQCVHKHAKQAGIYPMPSPHVLRHAFATHLLNHGADLRVVQTLLGHENITTTEIYTHVSRNQLHDEVNRSHPMGKRKN